MMRLAVIGLWIAALLAGGAAAQQTPELERAEAQRDAALERLSRVYAKFAIEADASGATALLLALEGLPGGGGDGQVYTPEAETALYAGLYALREMAVFGAVDDSVSSGAFISDGSLIVTGTQRGAIVVYHTETGEEVARVQSDPSSPVAEIAFSAGGSRLLSRTRSGSVILWDVENGARITELEKWPGGGRSARFSPDGAVVMTTNADQELVLWDAAVGERLRSMVLDEGQLSWAFFSPDGSAIYTVESGVATRMWSAADLTLIRELPGQSTARMLRGDGRRLLTLQDGAAVLWDPRTGAELRRITSEDDPFQGAALSPFGAMILTVTQERVLSIWDASSGEKLSDLIVEGHPLEWVRFSPDGAHVATRHGDGRWRIWAPASGRLLMSFDGRDDTGFGGVFGPGGDQFLTLPIRGAARLWNVAQAPRPTVLTHPGKPAASLAR